MRLRLAIVAWVFMLLILALVQIDAASAAQIDIIQQQSNPVVTDMQALGVKEQQQAVEERIQEAPKPSRIALGTFTITYYDADIACTGKEDGITYMGRKAKVGRTIAVDPTVIPLGSKVYIEGIGECIAEDIGGAINQNRIDVFVETHKKAERLGKHEADVYLIMED